MVFRYLLLGVAATGFAALHADTMADDTAPSASEQNPLTAYDPYPAGILPDDLDAEIERLRAENREGHRRALVEARALGLITRAGNPPIIAGNGYEAINVLGELLNYDENMSVEKNQACSFCHMPYTGFAGSSPSINATMSAYPGSLHYRAIDRIPMRYTYAPRFPVLQYNETQGDFFGGNFWDGRATGYALQSPNAEQASDPPVGAVEQGFADGACIAYRLSQAEYRDLFEAVWGQGLLSINWPDNTEEICATPAGATDFGGQSQPIMLSEVDRMKANAVFDHWGQSVSFYQSHPDVTAFSSKFDAFLAGDYQMTPDEMAGYQLFRGKANCNSCHLDGTSTADTASAGDEGTVAAPAPLFTDFTYVNLGVPMNPRLPFYYETEPDQFGNTPNPHGFAFRDLGMGSFLRGVNGVNPNAAWTQYAPGFDGKVQVMTARNVAMTPLQCPTTEAGEVDENGNPVPYFQKSFFHNGYIKSLKQLVHFYNTRDVYAYPVTSGNCPAGTTERVDCWPKPEVRNNMDTSIGDLGLTDQEEDQVVAFLKTLTDGYTRPYNNIDLFTGQCQTGGDAATQGNELLIATPALPACAGAICGVDPVPNPPIE